MLLLDVHEVKLVINMELLSIAGLSS